MYRRDTSGRYSPVGRPSWVNRASRNGWGDMLEIAVLGLLNESPMHGYELRKRLATLLGTFRAFSYGSLYPTLRRLSEAGWLRGEPALDDPPFPSPRDGRPARSRRGKRVYRLTAEGK